MGNVSDIGDVMPRGACVAVRAMPSRHVRGKRDAGHERKKYIPSAPIRSRLRRRFGERMGRQLGIIPGTSRLRGSVGRISCRS